MEGLAFSIFNPGSQIVLHYRVHDNLHIGDMQLYSNRFNGKSVLTTGWNEVIIPIADILSGPQERSMDLTKISSFGIFVISQDERRVLYIDNVLVFGSPPTLGKQNSLHSLKYQQHVQGDRNML